MVGRDLLAPDHRARYRNDALGLQFEKRRSASASGPNDVRAASSMTLRAAVLRYALHAAVVVGAAVFLPSIAERIAVMTGLGQTFVGNIFVAITTSLPELTVSAAALRIGAVDMAVGNIFGSNLFNMAILAIQDIFYLKGPILSFVQGQHMIPTVLAMAMTGLAIAGLIYNAEKKLFIWAWDSFGVPGLCSEPRPPPSALYGKGAYPGEAVFMLSTVTCSLSRDSLCGIRYVVYLRLNGMGNH